MVIRQNFGHKASGDIFRSNGNEDDQVVILSWEHFFQQKFHSEHVLIRFCAMTRVDANVQKSTTDPALQAAVQSDYQAIRQLLMF